jgi:very-short-patch-repair endonuclease
MPATQMHNKFEEDLQEIWLDGLRLPRKLMLGKFSADFLLHRAKFKRS